ncbi:PAS domain-containing sensor histidine kinase [Micromonospora pattaloongensis]|uniref:PAS domain-containing sensor histidine kinase n=1 Tax=Micromonospora pattaloongensis TaxID=405436 RepID=UPI001587A98F|nr:PAS domain-containing protein [Micromonospora pattaloongensis]
MVAPFAAGIHGGSPLTYDDLYAMADAIPHILWATDAAGEVIYVNRRGVEYTGLRPEERRDSEWHSLIHADDADEARLSWEQAVRTETPYERDLRLRRADGEYRWHGFRTIPVRDADGRVVRWIGTATDIHDQKALEDSLRRSERQTKEMLTLLESLQAAAPVGFGFVDRDLRVVRANDVLATLGHGTMEEQIGRPLAEVLREGWPLVEPIYRRVLDTGAAVLGLEVAAPTVNDPDQVRSWFMNFYPVRVDGEIIGVGLVVVDITRRAMAEEFRSVVMDNMAEGLYTIDADGLLTSMNRAAVRMLGWEEAELRGRDVHSVVHFQRADGTPFPPDDCPLAKTRRQGRPVKVADDTFTRKDGSIFPVSYSAAPLRIGSRDRGAVVVFHDNTESRERQQRELEARHAQKLESLGRLSAGIAHEINTPIQFVGDNTRFLAEAYEEMLALLLVYRECLDGTGQEVSWDDRVARVSEAEQKADIDYLASEVPLAVAQSLEGIERVASLVRAMKSFSYKESNDRSYADLNEALHTTLTVARNEVKYVADVTLDLGEIPEVLCSLGDLNQVFLNLLVNAADAMQGKGKRGQIRVSTRTEGSMVVVSIADNGCGIPSQLQQVIFEPFFTTKEVGKGTGQGLALARAVVDQHAGTIEVNSREGEGTEFVLRLPIDGKRSGPA